MADSDIAETAKDKLTWTAEQTRFMIARRLDNEEKFNNGKPKVYHWGKIKDALHETFKEPPFTPTVDQVKKKFENEMASYRKEKRRKNLSGSAPPKYKFFKDFERVYHQRKDLNLDNTYSTQGPAMEAIIPSTMKRKDLLDEEVSEDEEEGSGNADTRTSSAEKQKKRRSRDTRTIMLKKMEEMEGKSRERGKNILKMVEDMTKGQERQNEIALQMLQVSQEFLQVAKGWVPQ